MRARVAAVLSTLVAVSSAASPAWAEAGWIPLGPDANQRVVSLTVTPGAPSQVYAGGVSGVFRTSDGSHWKLLDNGDGLPLGASGRVSSAPVPGSPVYLATGRNSLPSSVDGVFRSDDGGESWKRVKDTGGRLAVAPSDPSRLYLATPDGFETSRDGGDTWTPTAPLPVPSATIFYQVDALAVAPSDPEVVFVLLYATTDHGYPDEFRLLRSADGGGSWEVVTLAQSLNASLPAGLEVVFEPQDPETIYIVLTTGVYRSQDGGATWEPRNDGLPSFDSGAGPGRTTIFTVKTLAIDPESPSTLYAAIPRLAEHDIPGGVYRSTDAGATWAAASSGLPLPLSVEALALDPAHPKTVYAGTPKGVFRSLDGGGHWAQTPGSLPTPAAAVAIDPRSPNRLYAGSDDRRIFASDDGGQGWRPSYAGIPAPTYDTFTSDVTELTIAPLDPSILFMATAGYTVGRSTNGGASWQLLAPQGIPSDVRALLVDPRDSRRVLLGVFPAGGGVFASDDLGETWRNLLSARVSALVRAPSDPDVLYAGTVVFNQPNPASVCGSTDGGGTWNCTVLGFAAGDQVAALAVDPRDASVVLAALQSGGLNQQPIVTHIERSLDGGTTWTEIGQGLPEGAAGTDLAFDPRHPDSVWLATLGGGVFRSTDGGASWAPENRGLTHLDVHELAFDPSGRVLLAATEGGLFRYSTAAGPPPPPEAGWIADPALPGFRVKVRIAQGDGAPIPGTKAPACIPETICVAGALPDRAELFVRVVGPKPNGRLWPTLVKFSTSRIEIWIEQLSTGELRYYELAGASPGVDELPGLFDRSGFLPEP